MSPHAFEQGLFIGLLIGVPILMGIITFITHWAEWFDYDGSIVALIVGWVITVAVFVYCMAKLVSIAAIQKCSPHG